MEGYIHLNFLELEEILDTKLEDECRWYLVRWKGIDSKTWVTIETVTSFSLEILLRYYATFLSTLDYIYPTLNAADKAEKFFSLVSYCKKSDIESIVNGYLTINGLNFPPSKRDLLLEEVTFFVKNHEIPSLQHMEDLQRRIIFERILDIRREQLKTLKRSELEINLICENEKEISIENNVDLETLPDYFTYVNNYIAGTGVNIPSDPPIGCDCDSKCALYRQKSPGGSCCPDIADVEPAYDINKRLVFTKRKPIYECNKKCTCDKSCPNRVVQNGANIRLEIFRTFNRTGWGVRTLDYVPKGTFVARYVGEVILFDDGKSRSDEYMFDIDLNYAYETDECVYTVDAYKYGNISRFFNHSCDPNLCVFGVFIDCLDPDLHEIAFFAARDIIPGEEICFNYNKKMRCKCGSVKCKLK